MNESTKTKLNLRFIIVSLAILLTLYVVIPQIGGFQSSWQKLSNPDLVWIFVAIVLTAMTYLAGALTYKFIAFKALKYWPTVLVQYAAMFFNRLLPAGTGAIGVNYLYLHKNKHSSAQSASVVAINNLLGVIGHNLLFFAILIASGYSAITVSANRSSNLFLIILTISLLLVVILVIFRQKAVKFLIDFKKQLLDYRHRPSRLVLGLLSSMALTLLNVSSLYACAQALGVELDYIKIFLVFSAGIGTATITPTPGGLGGFEAGITAGLIAYNANSSTALAIALLYRLISYWLTLLAGAVAFLVSRRLDYI